MLYDMRVLYFGLIFTFIFVFPIVLSTYKFRNPVLRWCLIIIPPFFIIVYYWIPFDIRTTFVWFPADIACIWSIVNLLVNIIRVIFRAYKKKPQIELVKARFVRPILTICVFIVISSFVQQSRFSANEYAIEVGKEIQAIADTNGICPEKIQGWEVFERDPNICITMYGKYGTKYPVRYLLSEDRREFTISVYNNFDESFCVNGGVGLELKATHSYPSGIVEVPIE